MYCSDAYVNTTCHFKHKYAEYLLVIEFFIGEAGNVGLSGDFSFWQ